MPLFINLYDTVNGGGAAAFKCTVCRYCWPPQEEKLTHSCDRYHCKKITRTKRGMMMHLKLVHKILPQMELLCLTLTEKTGSAGSPANSEK